MLVTKDMLVPLVFDSSWCVTTKELAAPHMVLKLAVV